MSMLPPPPPTLRSRTATPRRGRPKFGYVIAAAVGIRVFREVLQQVASSRWGVAGSVAVVVGAVAFVLAWRADQRRRARARGGVEHTPEAIRQQLADSELLPPAFQDDGTVLGASMLVVNQRPKVLEVETEYEVFGADAAPLGTIRQIGQSRAKQVARVLTAFDQLFTHHFELRDLAGTIVLRFTRPAKLFRSRVHVFDGQDRFIGTIRQANVFWKIRFALIDPVGNVVGHLTAANVRAWDFHVEDALGRPLATVVKSWEGWGRTAFTRADRYVLKLDRPLPYGLCHLVLSTPLVIDVALKQDARGFG